MPASKRLGPHHAAFHNLFLNASQARNGKGVEEKVTGTLEEKRTVRLEVAERGAVRRTFAHHAPEQGVHEVGDLGLGALICGGGRGWRLRQRSAGERQPQAQREREPSHARTSAPRPSSRPRSV